MRKVRAWALALCAVLACGKESPNKTTAAPQAVATLAKIEGKVSHRPAGKLGWSNAQMGMALNARDAIKTDKGATATLVFRGGGKLEVDEQTLIIVEAPRKAPNQKDAPVAVARVEKGTVRGVAKPGAKPLEVVSKGGERTRISATTQPVTFRVRAREGAKLQVAALKGAAKVQVDDQTLDLQPNQAVEVDKKKVGTVAALPAFPELTSPAVDEALRGQDVKLSWKSVEGAVRYRIQLARTLDFSDLILDNITTTADWTVARLAPGKYVWRVSSANARGWEGEFGFARRFRIAKPQPASRPASQLISPAPDASVVTPAKRMSVNFRWKEVEGAKRYVVVVARRPNLKRRVAKVQVKGQTSTLLRLRQGTFYWGVYAVDAKGKRTPLFDKPSKLKIGRRRPPNVGVPRSIDRWR